MNWNLCLAVILRAPVKPERYADGPVNVSRIGIEPREKLITYLVARAAGKYLWFSRRYLERFFARKIDPLVPPETEIIHFIPVAALFGLGAHYLARKRQIPFVMTPLLHLENILLGQPLISTDGKPEHIDFDRYKVPTREWHDAFWLRLVRSADALITLTEFETECLHHNGVPRRKLHRLGLGPIISEKTDPAGFRAKWNIGDRPMVLFVGRMNASKAIREIALGAESVWKRYPETRFVFIGPPDPEPTGYPWALSDDRVICTGPVELEEKSSALAACDVFCMPSRFESLGVVYLEAWAYEKPVIAADIPTSRELTGGGQGGILVDVDPASISRAVIYLLDHPGEAREMGRWGKENVLRRYEWDVITENLEKIYRDLTLRRSEERATHI